jgi:hypothetical protein
VTLFCRRTSSPATLRWSSVPAPTPPRPPCRDACPVPFSSSPFALHRQGCACRHLRSLRPPLLCISVR